MAEELKPCPFCGPLGKTRYASDGAYVTCDTCNCDGPFMRAEIPDDFLARRRWNTRAPHDCREAVVRVLRRIAEAMPVVTEYFHPREWVKAEADRIEREGLPPEGGEEKKP